MVDFVVMVIGSAAFPSLDFGPPSFRSLRFSNSLSSATSLVNAVGSFSRKQQGTNDQSLVARPLP
jgi:hypothetical protein